MNIDIVERYHNLRNGIAANWKEGVGMIGVAVVVGRVYGRAAAVGVVLITVSNYPIIGRQVRVISWMSLRKALIAFVVLGNNYYFTVISPQIMCNIAVALLLIDNFLLSSINAGLSAHNTQLEANNAELVKAHESLQKLEEELQKLLKPASELREAKAENAAKAEKLDRTIAQNIQDIPTRLQNVNTLLTQLLGTRQMQELIDFEQDLRTKMDAMLKAFDGVLSPLQPLTVKVSGLSESLASTAQQFETQVTITGLQIEALKNVFNAVQNYRGRL